MAAPNQECFKSKTLFKSNNEYHLLCDLPVIIFGIVMFRFEPRECISSMHLSAFDVYPRLCAAGTLLMTQMARLCICIQWIQWKTKYLNSSLDSKLH